jgi:hypothetical protein
MSESSAAIAFLASDAASDVTGICLSVDGGLNAWVSEAQHSSLEHIGRAGVLAAMNAAEIAIYSI